MKDSERSGGIGFMGLLVLLFIGLKLTNYIAWSWWWVLAPMWILVSIACAILAFLGVIAIVAMVVDR